VLERLPPCLEILCLKVVKTGCEGVMFAVFQETKVGGCVGGCCWEPQRRIGRRRTKEYLEIKSVTEKE
jgi:hypothetical protein